MEQPATNFVDIKPDNSSSFSQQQQHGGDATISVKEAEWIERDCHITETIEAVVARASLAASGSGQVSSTTQDDGTPIVVQQTLVAPSSLPHSIIYTDGNSASVDYG